MKKLLLTICAMLATAGMYAQYAVNDYIFTAKAKYKVTEVLDIDQPGATWNNYSSEFFSPYTAQSEEEYDGIQSTSSEEGSYISTALPLEYGANYIITFKFMGSADATSSITDGALNHVNAWVSANNDYGMRAGTANIDYQQVASTFTIKGYEFVEVSWAFSDTLAVCADADGGYLNFTFNRINTESVIATDMQIVKVVEVYDTRISDRAVAFAKALMEDPNFNTEAAAEARGTLAEDIAAIEEASVDGTFDDQATAEEYIASMDQSLQAYLDVETTNFTSNSYFNYIENLSSIGKYNRGSISNGQVIGGFVFRGSNWMHGTSGEYLSKGIQGSYSDGWGSVGLRNTNFPAGKYYIAAEVRNAVYDKNYGRTYTRENNVKAFVGTDTLDCGMISGENFQKFYFVGEIKEGEDFEAGFWYPGYSSGTIFDIYHFEIRGFGDIEDQIKRKQAWNTFIAQWNAAVSARNAVIARIDNKDYPWEQDSLKNALAQWDPYYNAVLNVWVDEEGNDLGTATNEELTEWATYQGVEIYEEDGVTRKTYQLVRNYQWASTYVTNANKPIPDLLDAIAAAISLRDDDMNLTGDKSIINDAVAAAQAVYDDIVANTTNDRREADEARIAEQIAALEDAKVAFKESVKELEPFIDIEFSGGFTAVYDEEDPDLITGYVVNGKSDYYPQGKGQMTFATLTSVELDNTVSGTTYQIGVNGLLDTDGEATLHVGSSKATVPFGEENIPTDEDVIRVQFDIWYGSLSKCYATVELQNEAGERVGGFSVNRYNGIAAYNDFNNQTGAWNDITSSSSGGGTGMNVLSYATSSTAGDANNCVDSNKSSFDLIFDYKARALKGTIVNGKNGTCEGAEVPMLDVYSNTDLTDNKVAKFIITTNYTSNAPARRCWFDNLKVYKYASSADGPHFTPEAQTIPGDVNGDEVVDIKDVVAIINHIAGTDTYENANVNGDKDDEGNDIVDINDVVAVINIMAGN